MLITTQGDCYLFVNAPRKRAKILLRVRRGDVRWVLRATRVARAAPGTVTLPPHPADRLIRHRLKFKRTK